ERGQMPESKDPEDANTTMQMRSIPVARSRETRTRNEKPLFCCHPERSARKQRRLSAQSRDLGVVLTRAANGACLLPTTYYLLPTTHHLRPTTYDPPPTHVLSSATRRSPCDRSAPAERSPAATASPIVHAQNS